MGATQPSWDEGLQVRPRGLPPPPKTGFPVGARGNVLFLRRRTFGSWLPHGRPKGVLLVTPGEMTRSAPWTPQGVCSPADRQTRTPTGKLTSRSTTMTPVFQQGGRGPERDASGWCRAVLVPRLLTRTSETVPPAGPRLCSHDASGHGLLLQDLPPGDTSRVLGRSLHLEAALQRTPSLPDWTLPGS